LAFITACRSALTVGWSAPRTQEIVTNRIRRLHVQPASLFEMLEAQAGEPVLQQRLMARAIKLAEEYIRTR
jgi:hypothetical protein